MFSISFAFIRDRLDMKIDTAIKRVSNYCHTNSGFSLSRSKREQVIQGLQWGREEGGGSNKLSKINF